MPSHISLITLLAVSASAFAQSSTTGALSGTVKSAAGVALPGTAVLLVNSTTNQSQTTVTATNGTYSFALLPPGTYALTFTAKGFQTAAAKDVTISIADTPTLDARLEPGGSAEPLPCHCTFNVTSSATSTVINSKTITAVPLTTRNFTQVLSMASGSAADVNNAGTLGRGTRNVNVNGNTSASAYSLDGAYAPSAVPNPDTISELKIQTSQYDAVYGAQVPNTALVTKSGENDFHGGLWEFVRNDIFNANSFFRGSTGQNKPHLKQNQFGATIGGPVLRQKLFFFGSYQGTRQINGLDQTSTSNVILPPLTHDRSAAAITAQFCPAAHPLASGQADPRYQTYAGGKQLDCRNQATPGTAPLNPVALRLLQRKNPDGTFYIPVPQTLITTGPSAGLGFSSYSLPSFYDENQYMLNTDYAISPKHTLAVRMYVTTINQFRTFGSPQGYPGTQMVPGGGTPQALHARDNVASLALTSAISKAFTSELRLSYTRSRQNATGDNTPTATAFGITPANRFFDQPPETTILGPLGSVRLFGNFGNDFGNDNTYYNASANLSWVHGNHRTRAGGVFFTQSNFRDDIGNSRGKIFFQTFSDFLIGLPAAENNSPFGRSNVQNIQANEGAGPYGQLQYQYRSYYGAFYLQDDYKWTQHLTINAGLRWEYIGAATSSDGSIGNVWPSLLAQAPIPPAAGTFAGITVPANYNPNTINPYTGKPFGPAPTGVLTRNTSSFYSNKTPKMLFAPRTGFAWQPSAMKSRFSLRGGFGYFYQPPLFSANASGQPLFTAQPFAQGFTNADSSNGTASFQQPFPAVTLGFIPRTPTSQLSDRIAGPVYTIPRLLQWNLSLQTKLARALTLDIGYVGSAASRLLVGHGMNQPLLASAANPVNCGYDSLAAHCITTNTAANARLRVPVLGETPTALVLNDFTGASDYHSLQVTLRKQATHSLSFQATYTLSRAANNTTVYNNLNNLDHDWARATFDRTHRATTNFDYHLPLRSKSAILNGWTLAGIIIIQSGLPMTLTDPNGGSVYGRASTSTASLCPGATYGSLATPGTTTARLNNYINSSAICAPPPIGSDGSTGYGNSGQSILVGPGQLNTDFSLGKTTRVGGLREDAVLAFRMEMYNALNHPQFANPGTALGTATFGVITQNSVAPRLIQFAVKYLF